MNNATYFNRCGGRMSLAEAFRKWRKARNIGESAAVALMFAGAPAMTVLGYDVGKIVQLRPDADHHEYLVGKYGIVVGYHAEALELDNGEGAGAPSLLKVEYKRENGGTYVYELPTYDLVDPKIPEGIVELVKAQLKNNCPLKDGKGC